MIIICLDLCKRKKGKGVFFDLSGFRLEEKKRLRKERICEYD